MMERKEGDDGSMLAWLVDGNGGETAAFEPRRACEGFVLWRTWNKLVMSEFWTALSRVELNSRTDRGCVLHLVFHYEAAFSFDYASAWGGRP
jgi:hypothetical protein